MFDNPFLTDRHGWAELLPRRQPMPPLVGHHRVPWAVIGAGVTGLAAARRLAEKHPNDEIYLLDAREVGQAASGRNSGFAVAVSHFPGRFEESQRGTYARVNRINQAGLTLLRHTVKQHRIDCQWAEDGFYHPAADDAAVAECANFRNYLERMEVDHAPLDRDELAARLGTAHYRTGVHVRTGALVQPAALVRGLADSLPANVRLFEDSPVLKLWRDVPLRLDCADGEVTTDKVILATNHEALSLGYLKGRISASTLSGSFTRILSDDEFAGLGSIPHWGVLSLHGGGATIRLTQDRRLSIRNTSEYRDMRLLTEAELAARQAVHRESFDRRFPQLSHVPFEFAWSGVEGGSRNGTNFFGQQSARIYLAGGYNGSGVSRGTAFGTAIADLAGGDDSGLVDDCAANPKAKWIPPSPLKDLGAWWTFRRRYRDVGLDR